MLPTAKPEVITTPLTVDHEFVVLACDGTYVCMCVCVLLVCVCVCTHVCVYTRELCMGAYMCTVYACTFVSQGRTALLTSLRNKIVFMHDLFTLMNYTLLRYSHLSVN